MRNIILLTIICCATNAMAFDCAKKTCKQMSSCEEAQYKLNQCGHTRLDRDKDNVPCENICLGG